jgi:hypothetical protein
LSGINFPLGELPVEAELIPTKEVYDLFQLIATGKMKKFSKRFNYFNFNKIQSFLPSQ